MDINFEKDKVTSDFKEAEILENIKSGERLSVIFGKIQRWFSELGVCVTEDDLQNALKDLPKRCYVNEIPRGLDLHPMGENNSPNGDFSITSGQYNTASGNFSSTYGYYNRATNLYSFAMGYGNKSYESYAIAIGTQNNASGFASIAIGQDNTATKDFSLAIGRNSNAKANFSLAIGEHCIASGESQTVLGKYNIADNNDKYAFIIGSGDSDKNRSNALTLDWNGNLWLSGDITATDTDGQEISLSTLRSELSQTEINVMNVVTNQNNLIKSNNAEHTILYDSLGMQKKNWLKNTHSVGSTTINGITFTTNADGSVTANGTATADASYNMVVVLPPNTSFILSGCPSGGSTSTYNIFAIETDSFVQAYRDIGNGAEFNTGSYTEWSFRIRVVNGQTVNDLTFYPMVRSAAVSDSEYAPYTDDLQTQINELKAQVAALTGAATVSEIQEGEVE